MVPRRRLWLYWHGFLSSRDASGAVDNWSSGGLAASPDTGTLGEAVASPKGGTPARLTRQPDTGAQVAGTVVPS